MNIPPATTPFNIAKTVGPSDVKPTYKTPSKKKKKRKNINYKKDISEEKKHKSTQKPQTNSLDR